jgi:hypothetical protein
MSSRTPGWIPLTYAVSAAGKMSKGIAMDKAVRENSWRVEGDWNDEQLWECKRRGTMETGKTKSEKEEREGRTKMSQCMMDQVCRFLNLTGTIWLPEGLFLDPKPLSRVRINELSVITILWYVFIHFISHWNRLWVILGFLTSYILCASYIWLKWYKVIPKSFRTESITKQTTTINTRWEAAQRVMAAKLTRLTHKIAVQLHLVAESCTICSSRFRWPVRELFDTRSHFFVWISPRVAQSV